MNARRRTRNLDDLDRMIFKPNATSRKNPDGKAGNFYYDQGASKRPRYLPLGKDRIEALRRYASLEQGRAVELVSDQLTFTLLAGKFINDVIPTKAKKTQIEYRRQAGGLIEFFQGAPLAEIDPVHLSMYRTQRVDKHGKPAIASDNRELALFSTMWNHAREWGMTDRANPAVGVKRH